MRRMRLALTGEDAHWTRAVRGAVRSVNAIADCQIDWVEAKDGPADHDTPSRASIPTVLLVDATAAPDIEALVREYVRAGWREIVVVAANPNWREAHAILQRASARDYWPKSYDVDGIRWRLAELLREVTGAEVDGKETP